jgi:uncharacterized protein (TIGR02145 family)
MNTKIFKLITAIIAVLFATLTTTAQEEKTMYVMKDNWIVGQYVVSGIDSIIFYKPSALTIPEGGVLINGVVWASCNVDAFGTFAATPESSGMFYQWNRKEAWSATGTVTGWDSSTPTGTTWEKSNDTSPTGWRVPTREEQQKLLDTDKVTSQWVTQNSVTGMKFTDKATGNSLFLPAAGYRFNSDGELRSAGSNGSYWSSTPLDSSSSAYDVYFGSSSANMYSSNCRGGFSVRAVAE